MVVPFQMVMYTLPKTADNLYLTCQKHIIKGVAAGAVKG